MRHRHLAFPSAVSDCDLLGFVLLDDSGGSLYVECKIGSLPCTLNFSMKFQDLAFRKFVYSNVGIVLDKADALNLGGAASSLFLHYLSENYLLVLNYIEVILLIHLVAYESINVILIFTDDFY
jgi:hypothetical protein